jgi:hypothetical protein
VEAGDGKPVTVHGHPVYMPGGGGAVLDDPGMSNIEGFLQLSPHVSVLIAAVTVLLDDMNLV